MILIREISYIFNIQQFWDERKKQQVDGSRVLDNMK